MPIDVYNFIWTRSRPLGRELPVQHRQDNRVDTRVEPTKGVILFPALLTPLVHVEGAEAEAVLELLVATEKRLDAEMVSHQLKLSRGLQPWKPYRVAPMFGGASLRSSAGKIVVEAAGEVSDDEETILPPRRDRFSGVLQKHFAAALQKQNCKRLYRVLVHDVAGCLASACPERPCPSAADLTRAHESERGLDGIKFCSWVDSPPASFDAYRSAPLGDRRFDGDIRGTETHDAMIAAMVRRRFAGQPAHLPAGGGRFCFAMNRGREDVDPRHFDGKAPLQAYHPLYVFSGREAFRYANVGHLSDMHVNCRWDILRRSPARVIEGDPEHSPPVGERVSDNNRSFVSVLSQLVAADSQLLVVGGDIVDHIRNAHWDDPRDEPAAGDIWRAVNMDSDTGGYSLTSYPAGIDLVAFYTLILRMACAAKPVFVLTGNHDCYYEAFGISPRIKLKGRGNPGIPADLNLTMYEALLAFGPSSGFSPLSFGNVLRGSIMPFDASWFEWFYTVLTPFRDYTQRLPKQTLVACGWGYGEDVLTDWPGAQGMGHLGRSDDAITAVQLKLIREALQRERTHKVVLASHFTFASYRDDVPMLAPSGEPTLGKLNGSGRRNEFDWGTYEEKKSEIHELLDGHAMLVVTGHTHRRGVYRIAGRDGGDLTIDLAVPPPSGAEWNEGIRQACIVVSDSAGPYPRSNRQGEFFGWGSDVPSGTLVVMDDEKGFVSRIQPVRATRRKPRAAVAVDYVDLQEGRAFPQHPRLPAGCIAVVAVVRGGRRVKRYVRMPLNSTRAKSESSDLVAMGVRVHELVFVTMARTKMADRMPAVHAPGSGSFDFEVDEAFGRAFDAWLATTPTTQRFLSVKLRLDGQRLTPEQAAHLQSQYDWDDWWHIEAKVTPESDDYGRFLSVPRPSLDARVDWYCVKRATRDISVLGSGWFGDASYPDVPDYHWRQVHFPEIYRGREEPPPRPPTGRRRRPRRVS